MQPSEAAAEREAAPFSLAERLFIKYGSQDCCDVNGDLMFRENFELAIAEAGREVREECAKIAETHCATHDPNDTPEDGNVVSVINALSQQIAAAIRQKGEGNT